MSGQGRGKGHGPRDGRGRGRGPGLAIGLRDGLALGGRYFLRTGLQNETGPRAGTPYCLNYKDEEYFI